MIQVYRYDEDFLFDKPVLIENPNEEGLYIIPKNCTEIQPPSFYKAKFDIKKQKWFESATQEYIDSLKPEAPEPTEAEKTKQQLGDLTFQLMMSGVI
ncbi:MULTISPECIES: hypothetical protein [Bacillus]|uniref:hypothetical protein n=1 Tax=Bacillus TaxID=1386 RepID=UPI000C058ED6|nr:MULTISPECIES: hypothetical protein [Bacillus]ATO29024.1 hypothetical protein RA13_14260 [Bacillus atrophaeus]MCI3196927.1 hypothetical protein [Bacillus sp. HU-1818]MCY8856514.1 hypothetical protein [Bacillus atrophaeus]MEC5219924.1 hypothetical protein [Bacillus atrophaeus]